ncbi:related to guanine nucleotide-binding protein alpha-4 subunit [Serendipita indica DSM 11827]|uniref:Related to guanine nucleotide-binding protein alpha-4 subunit n=1 Tax=Serendipita indica (strain DSM 11827) TaxID=1109443 RepID=G4TNE1_SERID|nr:related to guanine nucleotide-binding protein alpha-4 subunit [Serendipita indica DSM 11827]
MASISNRLRTVGPPQFKMNDISDPLTRQLMQEREMETADQAAARERAEREALKRSREIDEWLQKERSDKSKDRKRRKVAKILLVGQSESGKSTTLKNFQLHYAPKAFQAERHRWKTVIHLNIVRSIRKIDEALSAYSSSQQQRQHQQSRSRYGSPRSTPLGTPSIQATSNFEFFANAGSDEDDEDYDLGMGASSLPHRRPRLTSKHNVLLLRLRPLLSLEPQLIRTLLSNDLSNPAPPVFLRTNSSAGYFSSGVGGGTVWRNEVPDEFPSPLAASPSASAPAISPLIVSNEVALPAGWNSYRSASAFPVPTNGINRTESGSSTGDSGEGMGVRGEVGNDSTVMYEAPSVVPITIPRRMHSRNDGSLTHASPNGSISYSGGAPVFSSGQQQQSILQSPLTMSPSTGLVHPDRPFAERVGHGSSQDGGPHPLTGSNMSIRGNMRSPTPSVHDSFEVPERVLSACAPDILTLWRDEVLRNLLCGPLSTGGLGLKLHEDAGFFLDDIERITAPNYLPTDDDVLRARLKTMGVSEHHFVLEEGDLDLVTELVVYDVGGARTQRHQWMQFFDDVNVIVFLAPISPFDQRLAEDPTVNRLQDTFSLWKDVCRSPALSRTDFLLFLNKCDLLDAKLRQGLKLHKFIPQYNGGNNLQEAVKFFRGVFYQIWHKSTQGLKDSHKGHRALYIHSTSMIDIKTSRAVIENVQECAVRSNLKTALVI